MDDFGVEYVVLEGSEFHSPALNLLRDETKSANFRLMRRIALRSSDWRLANVPLSIFHYEQHKGPKPGARLQMNIPLMDRTVDIRLDELRAVPR